jgi:hypothetical protein
LPRFMKVVGWKIQKKTGKKNIYRALYRDGIDTNIEFSILLYIILKTFIKINK